MRALSAVSHLCVEDYREEVVQPREADIRTIANRIGLVRRLAALLVAILLLVL